MNGESNPSYQRANQIQVPEELFLLNYGLLMSPFIDIYTTEPRGRTRTYTSYNNFPLEKNTKIGPGIDPGTSTSELNDDTTESSGRTSVKIP